MSLSRRTLLAASLCALGPVARAQEAPPEPPKVLQIFQEFVKVGKHAAHASFESGWPAAFAKAGSKDYYYGLTASTGATDALYIGGFKSYADLQRSNDETDKAPGLQATLEKLSSGDAEFLNGARAMIATRYDTASIGTPDNLLRFHGFFIRTSRVKIGHTSDFLDYIKLSREGYQKAGIDPHIIYYVVEAGVTVPTYMSFRGFHSLSEMDEWAAMTNRMRAGLSEEQRQRLDKLAEAAFTSREGNVFMINPKMSYVPAATLAADPSFWKNNPVALAANQKKAMVQQAGNEAKKP